MQHDFYFHSRGEMIGFAGRLADVIRSTGREQPWFIALEGDAQSGKSIIPLALDRAFNDAAYPHGIERGLSADRLLRPGRQPSGAVVFYNFGMIDRHGSYDSAWYDFEQDNPGARVLVASNIERSIINEFHHATFRDSKRLDLALEFKRLPDGRRITATANDPLLQNFFQSLKPAG
jgi:hypothetical protein